MAHLEDDSDKELELLPLCDEKKEEVFEALMDEEEQGKDAEGEAKGGVEGAGVPGADAEGSGSDALPSGSDTE